MDFSHDPTATKGVRARFGPWDIDRYAATQHFLRPLQLSSTPHTPRQWTTSCKIGVRGLSSSCPTSTSSQSFLTTLSGATQIQFLSSQSGQKLTGGRGWPWLWSRAWARLLRRVIFLATNRLRPNNEICFSGPPFHCRTSVLELERLTLSRQVTE